MVGNGVDRAIKTSYAIIMNDKKLLFFTMHRRLMPYGRVYSTPRARVGKILRNRCVFRRVRVGILTDFAGRLGENRTSQRARRDDALSRSGTTKSRFTVGEKRKKTKNDVISFARVRITLSSCRNYTRRINRLHKLFAYCADVQRTRTTLKSVHSRIITQRKRVL